MKSYCGTPDFPKTRDEAFTKLLLLCFVTKKHD